MEKPSNIQDVRLSVITMINGSEVAVAEKVINHFVTKEVDRRASLLILGLEKLAEAEDALSKIKADHLIFADDGTVLSRGWSAKQKSEREKAQKVVDSWNEALTMAAGTGSYKLLEEKLKPSETQIAWTKNTPPKSE